GDRRWHRDRGCADRGEDGAMIGGPFVEGDIDVRSARFADDLRGVDVDGSAGVDVVDTVASPTVEVAPGRSRVGDRVRMDHAVRIVESECKQVVTDRPADRLVDVGPG